MIKFYKMGLILGALIFSSCLSLKAGLIGHWRFSGEGVSEFSDLSGLNKNAAVRSKTGPTKPTLTRDQIGELSSVVEFGGDGAYWISLPLTSLKGGAPFTIELWFKWRRHSGDAEMIVGNASGVVLNIKDDGKTSVMLACAGKEGKPKWAYAELPGPIAADEWIHLVLRYADGKLDLATEENGVLIRSASTAVEGAIMVSWPGTALGINPYGKMSAPFVGRMAAIKVYDEFCTDQEIVNSKP